MRSGSGCAGCRVARDALQNIRLPGVVLQELARQLDRVPGDAVDAGEARVVDARQEVMQAVTELVEQRQHIIVSQKCRTAAARRQEIAHEVGDRQG